MGSVGAPGGIQGTRTTRAPYASQPLFGRGNVPRPWPHPGQRVAPLLSSTQKKPWAAGRPGLSLAWKANSRWLPGPLWKLNALPARRCGRIDQHTRKTNVNQTPTPYGRFRRRTGDVRSTQYSHSSGSQACSLQRHLQNSGRGSLWMRGRLSTVFSKSSFFCDRTSWSLRERVCGKFAMRRGASLSETLRTRLNGSTLQQQTGYTLNSLPSCSKKGGHLYSHLKANPHYEAIGWLQASRQPLPRLHILQHIGLLDTHIDRR